MTKLTVVPPPPAAEEDLGDAISYLRQLMASCEDLCDAIERYLGPERPAPRPRLRVIPGGKAVRK